MTLSDYNFSCTSTDVPSFVQKYPKIKYATFDMPHNLEMDLCETSFKLLNPEISTVAKNYVFAHFVQC
jgi:hypothetical protein